MMKLYFKNSKGERLIAECETVQEVHKRIKKFLDKHGFKCYYKRSWSNGDDIMIDVGSYSEFFTLKGILYNNYIAEQEEEYHQVTMDEWLEVCKTKGE